MVKTDIASRTDIVTLVDSFYEKVRADNLLAPLFSHVDWPKHLPVMYDFWSSMILGDQSYHGNPFQKHLHLNLKSAYFDLWLSLFYQTVDERFSGWNADEIKVRAKSIAEVWQHKMKLKYS
jgi:hemoglobin